MNPWATTDLRTPAELAAWRLSATAADTIRRVLANLDQPITVPTLPADPTRAEVETYVAALDETAHRIAGRWHVDPDARAGIRAALTATIAACATVMAAREWDAYHDAAQTAVDRAQALAQAALAYMGPGDATEYHGDREEDLTL